MTSRHECKYWQLNLKYHYRHCRFCGRYQYDYGGVWKDQITFEQFINRFAKLGGTTVSEKECDIQIKAGAFFEFNSYEAWGAAIFVTINSIPYGPFTNLNHAMWNIETERNKIPPK